MPTISRRELIRITAAAATLPWVGAPATSARLRPADRRRTPEFAAAEQVPEAFHSLPFESQQLHGLLAERMRINVHGGLLRIDPDALLAPLCAATLPVASIARGWGSTPVSSSTRPATL